MKNLKWIVLCIVMAPMVFGMQVYVVELPAYDFELRVGQTMEAFGDILNDPNETLPYELLVEIAGPNNATWTYTPEAGKSFDWLLQWTPSADQIGKHNFIITSTDLEGTVGSSKAINVNVYPGKIPPVINVGGCRILQ